MLIHYGAEVTYDGTYITHKGRVVENFRSPTWRGASANTINRAAERIVKNIIRRYEEESHAQSLGNVPSV